jgi:hypothetical protein
MSSLASRSKVDVYPLSLFVAQADDVEWGANGEGGGADGSGSTNNNSSAGGGGGGNAAGSSGTGSNSINANNPGPPKDYSAQARMIRLMRRIDRDGGPIRSVEGVLLVHLHNHPHVLLFRQKSKSLAVLQHTGLYGTANQQAAYKLPGGKCRRDESEVKAMYRKLGRLLLGDAKTPHATPEWGGPGGSSGVVGGATPGGSAQGASGSNNPVNLGGSGAGANNPTATTSSNSNTHALILNPSGVGVVSPNEDSQPPAAPAAPASQVESLFRVGEVLALWHRPSFDRPMYPYIPPHVTQVKETRTIFLIHVTMQDITSGGLMLNVGGGGSNRRGGGSSTSNQQMELVAVPLFELFDNAGKYGVVASGIPHAVSRLHVNFC